MPKITIREDDLTQATGSVPSDVAFIIGFAAPVQVEEYVAAKDYDKDKHGKTPSYEYIEDPKLKVIRKAVMQEKGKDFKAESGTHRYDDTLNIYI